MLGSMRYELRLGSRTCWDSAQLWLVQFSTHLFFRSAFLGNSSYISHPLCNPPLLGLTHFGTRLFWGSPILGLSCFGAHPSWDSAVIGLTHFWAQLCLTSHILDIHGFWFSRNQASAVSAVTYSSTSSYSCPPSIYPRLCSYVLISVLQSYCE